MEFMFMIDTMEFMIGRFKIYNRALHPEEIRDIFLGNDEPLDDLEFEIDIIKGYMMRRDPKTGAFIAQGNLKDI